MLCFSFVTQLTVVLIVITHTLAQNGWSTSPFSPPAYPIAVRSPYLNSWLYQGHNAKAVSDAWPVSWGTDAVTGLYSLVVVDGKAYRICGATNLANVSAATLTSAEFTSTRTSFLYDTDGVQINASFLSPVEPTDLVRQSLPFVYLAITAESTDGNAHTLRMYSDISGEFLSPDRGQLAQWNSQEDGDYVILSMELVEQRKYWEDEGVALDATEYFAFKKIEGGSVSWAISNDTVNRAAAANPNVTLGNTSQPAPRQIQDSSNNWTTLGIAVDWGEVDSTPQPAVWALGLVRSPTIQYRTPSTTEDRYPYFLSGYGDAESALRNLQAKAFLDDFSRAQSAAEDLDARLLNAGQQFSTEYADLLALVTRQVMGCMDITLSRSSDGSWNMTDVKVFAKNMGGIGTDALGTSVSVNTVDTLYAAFPAFLYLNPELGGYLLSPLLEYQASPAYDLSYASRSIGSAYPNATADGTDTPHDYGIEGGAYRKDQTKKIRKAYSQRSGNGTFLSTYYTLLRDWADYLGSNTLTPLNQKSADYISDDISPTNNETNLALKGIIGIACMAKIAAIQGISGDQERFTNLSQSYISQWQENAFSADQSHMNLIYGESDRNGLIYNVFADSLLHLDLVPSHIYDSLTSFYANISIGGQYGIALDNRLSNRTMAHWMMFAASAVTNTGTRDSMVALVRRYAASNENSVPFPSTYDPSGGSVFAKTNSGTNSPASGAIFSLLALNTTIHESMNPPLGTSSDQTQASKSKTSAGAIAGSVIGGMVLLVLVALAAGFCFRRRRKYFGRLSRELQVTPIVFRNDGSTTSRHWYSPRAMSNIDEVMSSAYQSSQTRGLTDRLEEVREDREQLRADVSDLRRDLERLRSDLHESPPSYFDGDT